MLRWLRVREAGGSGREGGEPGVGGHLGRSPAAFAPHQLVPPPPPHTHTHTSGWPRCRNPRTRCARPSAQRCCRGGGRRGTAQTRAAGAGQRRRLHAYRCVCMGSVRVCVHGERVCAGLHGCGWKSRNSRAPCTPPPPHTHTKHTRLTAGRQSTPSPGPWGRRGHGAPTGSSPEHRRESCYKSPACGCMGVGWGGRSGVREGGARVCVRRGGEGGKGSGGDKESTRAHTRTSMLRASCT